LPTSLFDQVIATSGLSPIFAKGAITRALTRAGVNIAHLDTLTKTQLKAALPEINKTIQSFLGDQADEVIKKIEAMTI
jgi:hypothetical protein